MKKKLTQESLWGPKSIGERKREVGNGQEGAVETSYNHMEESMKEERNERKSEKKPSEIKDTTT